MLYFAVDSGTTNSRVWLMRDRDVLAKKRVPVGVRNTAIDGNNRALMEGIREAILQLTRENDSREEPQIVIAAGMITSNLGLHEVKHVQAPAGLLELASNIQETHFEDLKGISFYFIPGVRSGPGNADFENLDSIDIMRGEETEVMGALEEIKPIQDGPLLYIHLGSHTKMIQLDASRRISAGASTLAGELMQSIVEQTILRSSLPENPFATFNPTFFSQGWEHCQRVGFTRSLYEVRILQLNSGVPQGGPRFLHAGSHSVWRVSLSCCPDARRSPPTGAPQWPTSSPTCLDVRARKPRILCSKTHRGRNRALLSRRVAANL